MQTDPESSSRFLHHEPCPQCGSKDNLARYSDGHAWCFGCNYRENGDGTKAVEVTEKDARFVEGESAPIRKRGLSQDTCAKFGYRVGEYAGRPCQIAPYRGADGKLCGQKLRFPDKSFMMLGRASGLFGEHLFRDGGKMITITEGEIDCLSVSQAFGNKWPVVSVPNGAKGAAKAIKSSLEFLEKFETVVFFFDNDKPGREAANECALLLSPGKAKVVGGIAAKDANDLLVQGNIKQLVSAVYEAKTYRPDGVVCGEDLWERVVAEGDKESVPYPWQGLNDLSHGIRLGELVTLCAGTGVGKSLVCREIAYWLMKFGHKVGYIALEESVEKTVRGFMGIYLDCPPHHWDHKEDELKEAFDQSVGHGRLSLYDHFGSMACDNLLAKIRYMVRAMGANYIVLDHLSIVVSGMEGGDERREIDKVMTQLRSMCEELKCALFLVSHLKRPEGRGHEEGAFTSLAQLRGSHAIAQLSDLVLGLERNQQDDDGNSNLTTVRVLKNRYTGETGKASTLRYDPHTGRLAEGGPMDVDDASPVPF